MLKIVAMRVKILVDMLEESDIVFLNRILISLDEYLREKNKKL